MAAVQQDAERAVVGVEADDEHDRALNGQIGGRATNAHPIRRIARRCRSSFTSASSHRTTVNAPISMKLSSPKPASAHRTGGDMRQRPDDNANHVPAERGSL